MIWFAYAVMWITCGVVACYLKAWWVVLFPLFISFRTTSKKDGAE